MSEEVRTGRRGFEVAAPPQVAAPADDTYPSEDVVAGAAGFESTPDEMYGALHRAKLLGKVITRRQADEALAVWRTPLEG